MIGRIVLAFALLLSLATAEDWPQWRGPHRDGVVALVEPKAWPEKLERKWKIEIGEGHSSPILADGKIYLHSRQGDNEVVSAIRPESGQIIWQQTYPAPYKVNPAAERHGKGVKSTPVVADGRIYTLGIGGILSCFDAATGKPVWRRQFSAPAFGTAMSPLVDRGVLIAYVEGGNGGLTAFDIQNGAEKWSWKGDGSAYASPIVVELGGTRQVVTQSRKNIVSVYAATGEVLWQLPFTTAYEQNIVTPVLYRDLLIFSGLSRSVFAVKAAKRGTEWKADTVWENKDVPMYMNSPVLADGLLYGFTHKNKGQFFCLDPATGATRWTSEGRQGDNAAIVAAGSVMLLLTTEAELTIARRGTDAFKQVRKYTVADSPIWAHPLVVPGGIVIKDATTLALWTW